MVSFKKQFVQKSKNPYKNGFKKKIRTCVDKSVWVGTLGAKMYGWIWEPSHIQPAISYPPLVDRLYPRFVRTSSHVPGLPVMLDLPTCQSATQWPEPWWMVTNNQVTLDLPTWQLATQWPEPWWMVTNNQVADNAVKFPLFELTYKTTLPGKHMYRSKIFMPIFQVCCPLSHWALVLSFTLPFSHFPTMKDGLWNILIQWLWHLCITDLNNPRFTVPHFVPFPNTQYPHVILCFF